MAAAAATAAMQQHQGRRPRPPACPIGVLRTCQSAVLLREAGCSLQELGCGLRAHCRRPRGVTVAVQEPLSTMAAKQAKPRPQTAGVQRVSSGWSGQRPGAAGGHSSAQLVALQSGGGRRGQLLMLADWRRRQRARSALQQWASCWRPIWQACHWVSLTSAIRHCHGLRLPATAHMMRGRVAPAPASLACIFFLSLPGLVSLVASVAQTCMLRMAGRRAAARGNVQRCHVHADVHAGGGRRRRGGGAEQPQTKRVVF